MLVPLFPGVPGGPELLVLLLVMVLLFGVPLVLIAGGVLAWRRTDPGDGDRVAELEARVAELERELDAGGRDEPSDPRTEAGGRSDGEGHGGGRDSDGDGNGLGPDDDAASDPTDGPWS